MASAAIYAARLSPACSEEREWAHPELKPPIDYYLPRLLGRRNKGDRCDFGKSRMCAGLTTRCGYGVRIASIDKAAWSEAFAPIVSILARAQFRSRNAMSYRG